MLPAKSSIRNLLIRLVAALVVPLLGLLGYFGYRSGRTEVQAAEARVLAMAEATSLAIQQFLYDAEENLSRIAGHPAVRSLDPDRCAGIERELAEIFIPQFTNIFVWSLEDGEVCSGLPLPEAPGVDTTLPPWLPEAESAPGFWLGRVGQGGRSGRWNTALTYPIRGPAGERTGLVIVGLDLGHFQRILARIALPEGGLITVAQRDMVVVARSRGGEEWVGRTLEETSPLSLAAVETGGSGISRAPSMEGEDYFWGFVPVPNAAWIVFAGIPTDQVFGPIRTRLAGTLLVTLAILLTTFLLGWNAYRRITDPLASLVQEAATAKPGDSSPLQVRGPREIALVAQRFNEAWQAWGEAEKERKRSDERIRSLVENAITGVYVSTESGRFLEVNQAMVDLLGFRSREELLNTPVVALYESPEARERYIRGLQGRDLSRGVQVQWRRKDGAPLTVRLFARSFTTAEGEGAWEVIVEDVTALMSLQEQVLQGQKMEALGRLAGGIAHDFNNLLTVVQGQADLILDDPAVGEDLRAQLREISEAAARGGALNRQLLAFGRRSSVQRRNLDLNQVLQGIEIMLRRAAGEEVRLHMVLSPALGWILGDRSQVEQVIMNLVVNARDAMPRGGDLLIETYNTRVNEEDRAMYPQATLGPQVVLSVTDTGTGIDPKVLPHIFEPFFTTKPESQGTGLGLATVYGITAGSGGHLRVESVQGRGTTFRVFLPAAPSEAGVREDPTREVVARTGSGVILVAEDEEAVRRLAIQILERAGYEVISAASGAEALEVARTREGPIRLLLSDVVMPGLRGPELAETLAQEGRVRRAVLISGYADGMKEGGPQGLDAWELLPKPFNSAELLATIEKVLNA